MTNEEMQEMMRKGKVLQEIGHYAEALFYYRHAASLGNSDAMVEIGRMRLAGQGLKTDEGKAFKWFRKAANAGNVRGVVFKREGNVVFAVAAPSGTTVIFR